MSSKFGYPEEEKKSKELILGKVVDEIRKVIKGRIREKVLIQKGDYREYKPITNSNWDHPSKNKTELGESKPRDYKAEYKKYGSSTKAKKYRAELNKYNRQKGTYGNGDKKDASHKGGKIVGFEAESKNRGRAEKSRLKKEEKLDEFNKAHFLNLIKLEIDSLKGQIAYAKDQVNYKGTPDWEKKEFKAVLKDKLKDLAKTIKHYNRVKNLKEGKLTESQVAKTILQQLGGNRFIAMTGAKNFGSSSKSLQMKIGRNSKSISHVVITLKSSDLYDMEFIRIRGTSRKVVKKVTGVYADMLGTMFKKYTGMNVRL